MSSMSMPLKSATKLVDDFTIQADFCSRDNKQVFKKRCKLLSLIRASFLKTLSDFYYEWKTLWVFSNKALQQYFPFLFCKLARKPSQISLIAHLSHEVSSPEQFLINQEKYLNSLQIWVLQSSCIHCLELPRSFKNKVSKSQFVHSCC